jgi:16S rRNA (uracil1498-N3)-methyltransferase
VTAPPWFYGPGLKERPALFDLAPEESRHLAGSRRLRVGDDITVFDGVGTTAAGQVLEIDSRQLKVRVALAGYQSVDEDLPRIHLMSAVPKGDRQSTLLDMATQLGMSDYTPLLCERGASVPSERATARWQRIMIEACKQSRRPWIPKIHSPASLKTVTTGKHGARQMMIVADLTGGRMSQISALSLDEIFLLVGPEGGFSSAEIGQIHETGATLVALGSALLRTETAAVALVSTTLNLLRGRS